MAKHNHSNLLYGEDGWDLGPTSMHMLLCTLPKLSLVQEKGDFVVLPKQQRNALKTLMIFTIQFFSQTCSNNNTLGLCFAAQFGFCYLL
jgi:hypothetical protein